MIRSVWFGTSIMEHFEGFNQRMATQADLPEIGSRLAVEGWHRRGYVQRLELAWRTRWPHLSFDIDNRAQGGATSRSILQQARAWSAAGGTADLAFLGCGINDVWRGFQGRTAEAVDIHEFADNYRQLVRLLAGASHRLVCIAETPFGWDGELDITLLNRELANYNAVAAKLAATESVDFLDVWQAFTATADRFSRRAESDGPAETLWSDGVHLSELGDALMLQLVDDYVRGRGLIEGPAAGQSPLSTDSDSGRASPAPSAELHAFMAEYERATNTHDVTQVAPLICENATYWFTDGSHQGITEINAAIERTFATIQDELYTIHDLEWVAVTHDLAVCRYRFAWTGRIEGQHHSGHGRGTNVLSRQHGRWKILHEHLSS